MKPYPYGLETAEVGSGELNRIDAFQVSGIRKILGKKHTYWDRSATNDVLFDMAIRIVSEANSKKRQGKGEATNEKKEGIWELKKRREL